MSCNYLLTRVFGVFTSFLASILAREAIIGGHIAAYPILQYQVTILIGNRAPGCGGGILNSFTVLTAAHCVVGPNGHLLGKRISVLAGTYDLSIAGHISAVTRISIPKEYDVVNHSIGDIAVLKLNTPLHHDSIPLNVPKTRNKSKVHVHSEARIAGFGWDKMDEKNALIGEHSDNKLRYADVDIRSTDECQRDHPNRVISERHICARVKQYHKNHPRGACFGDDGSPLVVHVLQNYTVIGVLSQTVNDCSEAFSSGIYTRVAYYKYLILHAVHSYISNDMHVFEV